jgi:hypothetical protein
LKEQALDGTVWRTRFRRGYGSIARDTEDEWANEGWPNDNVQALKRYKNLSKTRFHLGDTDVYRNMFTFQSLLRAIVLFSGLGVGTYIMTSAETPCHSLSLIFVDFSQRGSLPIRTKNTW